MTFSDGEQGPLSNVCRRLGIHHPTFAVCITCFGSNLITATFSFYYVKVFLNNYHITEGWFQFAQILFLVWNAINDPLFGYFQDVGSSWMRSRKKSILYGTPFLALSYLLLWFPWGNYERAPAWVVGLHLIVALFFYDGLFSFVLLGISHNLQDNKSSDWADRVKMTKDVIGSPDFRRITATNFLHICRSTAQVNFAAIFTEGLISRDILPLGSWKISGFYGLCALVPQILVIVTAPLMVKHGPYRMMMWSFLSSMAFGVAAYIFGRHIPYVILIFMLMDCINVATFSPLMMVLFPDFIDDDMNRNRRSNPISSVVFSLNALFTKPAQSLAPMAIVYLLNAKGYDTYKKSKDKLLSEPAKLEILQDEMFFLLTMVPIVLAGLEFIVLRHYTLRNKHLKDSLIQNESINSV